ERDPESKGRAIAVSLFHALADWMNVPMMQHHYGGKTPGRLGLKHPTIAPYGVFDCADGKPLLISIQNEREWVRLCAVLGDEARASAPGFDGNSARVANRTAVDGFVQAEFSQHAREAMIAKLQGAQIAFGRLSDLDDFVDHPQNNWISVETPGEPIRILAPAAIVNGAAPALGAIPALDADGARLRAEFGSRTDQG
ncbi:MAG: CoA transferase, partial [Pseudomonadota bacterium]